MIWYLDTSVALHVLLRRSSSAVRWFTASTQNENTVISSRLLELEMIRVLRRDGLDPSLADAVLDTVLLLTVDDDLLGEAAAIRPHIRSLDALHLASAQRVGAGDVTVVTHDATMAHVADALGFDVLDPVA